MTTVVQDPNDLSNVLIFIKGADEVLLDLCDTNGSNHFQHSHLSDFAKEGYRTLLVGMKVMSLEDYNQWYEKYQKLDHDTNGKSQAQLSEHLENLEKDLFLLGTTALEDKLQDQVPECIEDFRAANIKVWMITGDKLETAENIGIS